MAPVRHLIRLVAATLMMGTLVALTSTSAHAAEVDATLSATSAQLGSQVTLSGQNWTHPSEGGSIVAVKIESVDPEFPLAQGTEYTRTGGLVHANATIWALVEAEADGAFDLTFTLPDGTTSGPNGTTTAVVPGRYAVRLLTGSLKPGDTPRSMKLVIDLSAPQVIKTVKKPKVSGKAKVGKKLKTNKGSWNTTVAVKYQWLRNGKAIKGATKAKYKVTKKDKGKKLKVKVTASKSGWKSASATSKAVKIKKK